MVSCQMRQRSQTTLWGLLLNQVWVQSSLAVPPCLPQGPSVDPLPAARMASQLQLDAHAPGRESDCYAARCFLSLHAKSLQWLVAYVACWHRVMGPVWRTLSCKVAASFLEDCTHVPQHYSTPDVSVLLMGTEHGWGVCHQQHRAMCNFHSSYCNYRSTRPAASDSTLSMEQAAPSTALVLTPRSNPRHLFVSGQLPSTGATPSISPSPTSAPSAPPQTASAQDDEPSSSKQPGTTSDALFQHGHAGQSSSRDQQPADEMPEDNGSNDTESLSDAQVKMRSLAAVLGHDAYLTVFQCLQLTTKSQHSRLVV